MYVHSAHTTVTQLFLKNTQHHQCNSGQLLQCTYVTMFDRACLRPKTSLCKQTLLLSRRLCWGLSPRCLHWCSVLPRVEQHKLVSKDGTESSRRRERETHAEASWSDPPCPCYIATPLSTLLAGMNWTPAEQKLTPQWRSREDGGWGGGRPGNRHQRLSHLEVIALLDIHWR